MSSDHDTSTFIVTSRNPPEDDFFQGYFFAGNDFVSEFQGARKFVENTGQQINPGQDGCYVHMRRHDRVLEFNTDFSGYKVLYYYHDGDVWAVSNSFAKIVDFLRSEKRVVRPNYPHLGSIYGTNSTNNQLFSFETLVQGVLVLPRATTLIVARDRVHLLRNRSKSNNSYAEGLREHLATWVSRFETLLSDDRLQFSIDLTGGLDSRTNLALALVAMRRLGSSGESPRFTCAGSPGQSGDYEVASNLSNHYGFELNPSNRLRRTYYTPEESYEVFRELSLGVYHPLVVPAIQSSPFRVHASGGGGEVHRDFYNPANADGFFENYAKRNLHSWLGFEAAQDGRVAVDSVGGARSEYALRLHYREFRHRYHVGRAPRFSTSFTPLDSMSAEAAQLVAGKSRVDEGQLNYDILSSLEPELLDLPFDSPSKAPSVEVRARLTSVQMSSESSPGKIWVGEQRTPDASRTAPMAWQRGRVVEEAVSRAVDNPFVSSFWGETIIEQAKQLAAKLAAGESVGNAVNGVPISAVLSAHLVATNR